jgi:hypothetical protein
MAASTRHRWLKLRIHVYICRTCGGGKVNALDGGHWQTTYHLPDGRSIVLAKTPACVPGPRTRAYLAKYYDEIAEVETVERERRTKQTA